MKLFKLLKTLCVVTTFLGVLAEDSPKLKEAKAASYRYSTIRNVRWTNQCLDLPTQGNGASGTLVQTFDCNGWSNQRWIVPRGSGTIRNVRWPGQCLDLPTQGNGASGTLVQTFACNGLSNQRWIVSRDSRTIRNGRWTGQYLDLPTQGNGASGTRVQTFDNNGWPNQRWTIVDVYY